MDEIDYNFSGEFPKKFVEAVMIAEDVLDKDTFFHSLRVAASLMKWHGSYFGRKDEIIIAAVLHDVVEDSLPIVSNYEIRRRFGNAVGNIVFDLTRYKEETYFDYIERIVDPPSVLVKFHDILDHLSQEDTLKPSLKKRYIKAKWELSKVLENNNDVDNN